MALGFPTLRVQGVLIYGVNVTVNPEIEARMPGPYSLVPIQGQGIDKQPGHA